MAELVKIAPGEFRSLALRPAEDVEFYGYDNPLLREMFWQRLAVVNRLLERHARDRSSCLDLGTGSGVFLPTLSRTFTDVVAVDQSVSEAANVVAAYGLANVALRQCDVLTESFGRGAFKAIVAADVLEHFPHTESIAVRLRDWLADDGLLVTSLPTESLLYVLLRKVFGVEKPKDHYFSAAEVEATLTRTGFTALRRCFVPFGIRTTSLFLVTAWRRTGAEAAVR